MKPRYWRDEIIRATKSDNNVRIDQLAAQLEQAEEARRLLQALTHCPACALSGAARLAREATTT